MRKIFHKGENKCLLITFISDFNKLRKSLVFIIDKLIDILIIRALINAFIF
jgi:hypothetical protein